MITILEIVLTGIVVFAFGVPVVIAFDKARKEMENDVEN
jgi:hypothetical protein